jgi:hypothetical protein
MVRFEAKPGNQTIRRSTRERTPSVLRGRLGAVDRTNLTG